MMRAQFEVVTADHEGRIETIPFDHEACADREYEQQFNRLLNLYNKNDLPSFTVSMYCMGVLARERGCGHESRMQKFFRTMAEAV